MSQAGVVSGTVTPFDNSFPITPYVVGPVGEAGYQTIQSAINAAHAAGGGTVYVQFGNYTENLTLYDKVDLRGVPWVDSTYVTLTGQHTTPASGVVQFEGFTFLHPSAIFNDVAAKNLTFNMINCLYIVTNGTAYNIPNYSGTLNLYDNVFISANDSILNNATGTIFLQTFDCALGVQPNNTTILCNGNVLLDNSIMWPNFSMSGSGTFTTANGVTFHNNLTFSGSTSGVIYTSQILSGSSIAITQNSSGHFAIGDLTIDSTATNVITGTGAITLGSISFINNSAIQNTIILNGTPSFESGELRAGADAGGAIGFTSLTKTNSQVIGAGTGTVKMSNGNTANNSAWIKIYIGNTPYWIPAWTTNLP